MDNRKGIVLAGGSGTRLYPITLGTSKQLLPVYDKPMIYYPISSLMLSNIRDILVISSPQDVKNYQRLLNDGSQFGLSISYAIQEEPKGIAEAFILGENFIENKPSALVLGDNIFYGQGFSDILGKANSKLSGATVFGYHVNNPKEFGVVEFDGNKKILSIEEKPDYPKSNHALTGLYFYDNDVVSIAKSLTPSDRGELEISDINNYYLSKNTLNLEILDHGFAWLDSGTHQSLLEASQLVQTLEKRQGIKIGCLEHIAYSKGWISKEEALQQAMKYIKTDYGKFIYNNIVKEI